MTNMEKSVAVYYCLKLKVENSMRDMYFHGYGKKEIRLKDNDEKVSALLADIMEKPIKDYWEARKYAKENYGINLVSYNKLCKEV